MRATTQALIAFLVVSLALPARSFAAPPDVLLSTSLSAGGPKISVVVVSLDAKASAQQGALEGAAEDALIRASRFTVLLNREAFNPEAAKKRNEALGEANDMVKFGMKSLEELDNVKATESFTAAMETLETTDLSRDFTALLEAWVMKAAGHATGGENAPAKKDIESIIGLNAKAEFTPTYFPPELLKFTEAQRKLVANAKGELLVRTEPAGARVWVDGVYRGVSPVNVAGLTAQKHYVTATLGGYALGQSQPSPGEEVISLAASELAPGWKKALSDIKKDPEGVTRDAAAQQLGKAAQLDQVFLVLAKKSVAGEKFDLIALRLETRDQHNLAYKAATVSPTDPEALAGFFDSLTGRDTKREGKEPLHHFKGGGGADVKTIAGVSLLGLAGVSAVTGVVFGVMAGNNAAQYKVTPQTRSFDSANLARDGRTFSVVADVSYLVAIAAGATGGVLLLTNKSGGDDSSAAEASPKNAKDDAKRRETEKRAAEERRASEERAKEDERRREDEKKREEEKRNQKGNDAKAAEDKKKADEEAKKAEEEAAAKKKAEDEANANKKLSKKEQAALEKKKKEEERQAKKEEEQRKKDEEKRAKEEERQRKEDEKKAAEEKKKQEAEEKAASGNKTKKQKEEEAAAKKKEEEEAAAKKKADDEAAAKKKEEEEAAAKKKAEEEKKKKEDDKKKKDEDHDDLRNF
ncbi:MAG: PEGA domain-containing protein [Archangium sp.]